MEREKKKMQKMTLGLCAGRHEMPVSGFIFENQLVPTDLAFLGEVCQEKLQYCSSLTLYVTGLSVALVSVINFCCKHQFPLELMHYDPVKDEYYPQEVLTMVDYDLLVEDGRRYKK